MLIVNEIEKLAKGMGATFVGYSYVEDKLESTLNKLPYAITIGVRLSDFIIDEISDKPTYTYFHHYRTVNFLIDQICLRILLYLQEKGFNAVAVPSSQTVNDKEDKYTGIFQHKTAAVRAGLGWMGKSGLFISNEYGPRVRLGTVITNLKLPENKEITEHEDCGNCDICVNSCPAGAIKGNKWAEGHDRDEWVDAKACSEYMNKNFRHIGRGSVCGICVKRCPKGYKR
jgi:Uncharacterized Fe-S protein